MDDTERLERAQKALGYTFQDPEILYQSLRHPPAPTNDSTLANGWSSLAMPSWAWWWWTTCTAPLGPWKKER